MCVYCVLCMLGIRYIYFHSNRIVCPPTVCLNPNICVRICSDSTAFVFLYLCARKTLLPLKVLTYRYTHTKPESRSTRKKRHRTRNNSDFISSKTGNEIHTFHWRSLRKSFLLSESLCRITVVTVALQFVVAVVVGSYSYRMLPSLFAHAEHNTSFSMTIGIIVITVATRSLNKGRQRAKKIAIVSNTQTNKEKRKKTKYKYAITAEIFVVHQKRVLSAILSHIHLHTVYDFFLRAMQRHYFYFDVKLLIFRALLSLSFFQTLQFVHCLSFLPTVFLVFVSLRKIYQLLCVHVRYSVYTWRLQWFFFAPALLPTHFFCHRM